MSNETFTKVQTKTRAGETSGTAVSTEIDKVILGTIAAFTGVVGLWSVACIGVAMYQAGGPFQLVGAWFKAVTGM